MKFIDFINLQQSIRTDISGSISETPTESIATSQQRHHDFNSSATTTITQSVSEVHMENASHLMSPNDGSVSVAAHRVYYKNLLIW